MFHQVPNINMSIKYQCYDQPLRLVQHINHNNNISNVGLNLVQQMYINSLKSV